MNDASELDAAVRAACPPIDGVWMGDPADKATWGIWFRESATGDQRAAAEAVLAAFTI